jgi:hypothetical protein
MNFRYLYSLAFLCCFFGHNLKAGNERFSDRLVYGAGFGLQFGDITYIQLAPSIGYKLTDQWIAGVGLRYIYLNDRLFKYESNVYGGSVFTQYHFLENFLTHAEVEVLNLDAYSTIEKRYQRTNITSILVGGGIKLYAGGNSFFTILGLLNLNETPLSPYSNPIIRAGFIIGM